MFRNRCTQGKKGDKTSFEGVMGVMQQTLLFLEAHSRVLRLANPPKITDVRQWLDGHLSCRRSSQTPRYAAMVPPARALTGGIEERACVCHGPSLGLCRQGGDDA